MILLVLISVGYSHLTVGASSWGLAETKITWESHEPQGQESVPSPKIALQQSLTWRWQPSNLPVSLGFYMNTRRSEDAAFMLDKGELTLNSSKYELRGFSNMGFGSTLDPMRLLSASRRADDALGFELKGTLEKASFRSLWLSEVANVGDDGPLLLLDMSLDSTVVPGKYRYLHIAHDSDWNWHHPRSGSYVTRTARQIHAIIGSWSLDRGLRVSGELATLRGFDVKKTYRRDLSGLAILVRGEGGLGDALWSLDLHRANPGFILATGDGDSLKPGREGVGLRITRARHRDESWRLHLAHDKAVQELSTLPLDTPGYVVDPMPRSLGAITYRRRWGNLSYRVGMEYERVAGPDKSDFFWELNYLPLKAQIGGKWSDNGSPQIYGKVSPHPQCTLNARWDMDKGWWRTALAVQSPSPKSRVQARWKGEAVYKKRPGEHYTYLSLQHKMDKGYWEIRWGKPDQGRLDWSWGMPPQVGLVLGRYF